MKLHLIEAMFSFLNTRDISLYEIEICVFYSSFPILTFGGSFMRSSQVDRLERKSQKAVG